MVKGACPTCAVYGIEVEPTYAKRFAKEWSVYETVFLGDAITVSLAHSKLRPDLVVFGDVLEHMWPHEASCAVEFWCMRSKYVVAIWPTGFPQDDVGGVQAEIHRCEIRLEDFQSRSIELVRYHKVARSAPGQYKHFAVFRGRIATKDTQQSGVAY